MRDQVNIWVFPVLGFALLLGLVKSLPPLHEVAAQAGVELPKYLGSLGTEPDPGPSLQGHA
jgi:hypothetical protein